MEVDRSVVSQIEHVSNQYTSFGVGAQDRHREYGKGHLRRREAGFFSTLLLSPGSERQGAAAKAHTAKAVCVSHPGGAEGRGGGARGWRKAALGTRTRCSPKRFQ